VSELLWMKRERAVNQQRKTGAGKSQRNQYAVDGEKQVNVKSALLLTGV